MDVLSYKLFENIKSSFSINNIYFDVILLFLFRHLYNNQQIYLNFINDNIDNIKRYGKYRIIINGKKHISSARWNNRDEFTDSFLSVLFDLNKKNLNVKSLEEISFNDDEFSNIIKYKRNDICNYLINQKQTFKINNDISCKITNTIFSSNEKSNDKIIEYSIKLYSNFSINIIQKYIENCKNKYKEYLEEKDTLYYFSIKNIDKEDNRIIYNVNKFISYKTFDNLFLNEKDKLIKYINFFKNEEEYYKKNGIPYRMSLLLYGKPGCGKTSLVKSIANYFNRHIMDVNLKKISKMEHLTEIFYTNKYDHIDIDYKNKILLFEDIDRMDVDLKNDELMEKSSDGKTILKTNEFNLSHFFNLLDGVNEMHGRILIMTTNHIEKIDETLIRSGRIDMKIEFDYMTPETLNELSKYYYNKELKIDKIKECVVSDIISKISHGLNHDELKDFVLNK